MRFKGKVTDNHSLSSGGNGVLYLNYTDINTGNTFSTNLAFPFDNSIEQLYLFDFEYEIPKTLLSRTYRFSLGANDGVRNVSDFTFFDVAISN